MAYTTDSPIRGAARGTPAGWINLLAAHNAPDAAQTVLAYFALAPKYGLNADLLLGQACHECTYFTDWKWTVRRNPAGIGVTSRSVPGPAFLTIERGVEAHCQHMSCHAYDAATCPTDHVSPIDPRHWFHLAQTTIGEIQGAQYRWAAGEPGSDPLDYVRSLCQIANQVAANGGPTMTQPWDRIHPSADDGGPRDLSAVQWFVVHDTEGRFAGDESVLTSAAAPIESVHFLIGRLAGQCVYSVPITNTAWTAGNDLLSTLAVQVELSKAPDESGYTDYQYAKLAEVFRWCRDNGMAGVPPVYLGLHPKDDNHGPLPDDPGIIGHAGVPNPNGLGASPAWGGIGGHTDPGPDFQWDRFIALIAGAAPPVVDDSRHFDETGQSIKGNIKGYWERFRDDGVSLEVFGLPVSDLVTEGGLPTQYFERQVLEDHGGRVMGRRLGAAAAAAAGLTGPGIP